jgi:aminopeptidase N
MQFYSNQIGNYPYKQYSILQGGDGGMEYAMCTLILGEGTFEGLRGVIAHEMAHSWFQHVLASNESKHPWMDEGFTSYLEDIGLNELREIKLSNPYKDAYNGYYSLVNSGNKSYSISSYSKGEIFLSQLEYLIGKENLKKTLKKYYDDFKFKHPTPNDIKRTAERITKAQLDWYLTDWTKTTNTIDYGIKKVEQNEGKATIVLERIGRMPMPIELTVEYEDGSLENFYIPLRMMHFTKENPNPKVKWTILNDWAWGNANYTFEINGKKINKITIDESELMADISRENNSFNAK